MTTLKDRPATGAADGGEAGKKGKKKGGKKRLIIIAVVVLVGAGGAYETVLAPKRAAATAAGAKPVLLPGPLVPTDAVTVNLTGGHYLRISLDLQFSSKVSATNPPDQSAALDQTIGYLTGQSADQLDTTAGLVSVKAALLTRIAAVYPKDPLISILVTSYVIQ